MAVTPRWWTRWKLTSPIVVICLALSAVLTTAPPVVAEGGSNDLETRLVLPTGSTDDRFGESVAIDDGIAVVGAWGDDGRGPVAGAAVVVEVDDAGRWTRVTRLEADRARSLDRFGRAVAVDGTTVVVGADNDRFDGKSVGSVSVFERIDGGIWVQTAKLFDDDRTDGAQFGRSVALEGDRLVVGSRNAVYVFDRGRNGGWVEVGLLKVPSEDFGFSVDTDGGRIVVGAPLADRTGDNDGVVYVFESDGAGGFVGAELIPEGGGASARFGHDVAISGDRIVAGVGGFFGRAFVFEGPPWRQVAVLDASEVIDFGSAVDIEGDRIVVGASGCDPACRGAGTAHVFELAADEWELTRIVATDGLVGDRYGEAVALSGDRVLVGAGGADQKAPDTGAVYLYEAGPLCLGRVSWIVAGGSVTGTDGPDVITGSNGADAIDGGAGSDVICAGAGDDLVVGGDGDDELSGDDGADDLRGGPGIDTVSYTSSRGPVFVSLNSAADDGTLGEGDRVDPSVENITGSRFADRLIGNDADNVMRGNDGNDVIQSRGGDDDLYGGRGDDQLRASAGTDELFGGPGDDELRGAAGNDYLVGGPGDDLLLGWAGTDICKGSAGADSYVQCEAILP